MPIGIERSDSWLALTFGEQISSAAIKRYLPGYRIYPVCGRNGAWNIVLRNQPFIIPPPRQAAMTVVMPDYNTSAAFVSRVKISDRGLRGARERLKLLADIQSWRLFNGIPDSVIRFGQAKSDPDWVRRWNYREEQTATGWRFHCALSGDMNEYSYLQIAVADDGTVAIESVTRLAKLLDGPI